MRVFAALLALGLASCASSPPPVTAAGPIAKGMARIIVTRSTDFQYGTIPAEIEVGGTAVAKLWRGESYAGEIAPGAAEIAVNLASRVHVDAQAGRTYRFAVSDNSGRALGGLAYEAASGTSGFFRIEAESP